MSVFCPFLKLQFFFLISFFSFHNIKNALFWYDFCEKCPLGKVRFLEKIHGLTPLKNVHFLALVKTLVFWFKNDCFFFTKYPVKRSFLTWESSIFGQNQFTNSLKNVHVLALAKTSFYSSYNHSFLPQYQKRCFLIWFLWKTPIRKSSIFGKKCLDYPL